MVRFKNHIWTVEHVVSNLLPVALGPLVVGSHPATMWLWFRWLSPRPLTLRYLWLFHKRCCRGEKNVFLCLCKYHTSICLCSLWSSDACFLSIALLSTLNSHSGYHLPFFPSPEARYVIQLYFQYFTTKSWKWFFHNCSADQYHKCVNSYLWRHMTSIIWSSTSVMESWEFSTTCTARTSSSGNIHIWNHISIIMFFSRASKAYDRHITLLGSKPLRETFPDKVNSSVISQPVTPICSHLSSHQLEKTR